MTIDWLKADLSADQFAQIESLLTIDLFYNTAMLTAKYLKTQLAGVPDAKVLVFGNAGMLTEV